VIQGRTISVQQIPEIQAIDYGKSHEVEDVVAKGCRLLLSSRPCCFVRVWHLTSSSFAIPS
jgi:hypothetical protein